MSLCVQVGILEIISNKMQDPGINARLRQSHHDTHIKIMKKLHLFLHRYVERKCQVDSAKNELLNILSANDLLKNLKKERQLAELSKESISQRRNSGQG